MAKKKKTDDEYIKHVKSELNRAKINAATSELGGKINEAVVAIMRIFNKQGHSAQSAELTSAVISRLMVGDVIAPITDDPAEWESVTKDFNTPMWQNKRSPAYFSKDGGKNWYHAATGEQGKSEVTQLKPGKKKDETKKTDK